MAALEPREHHAECGSARPLPRADRVRDLAFEEAHHGFVAPEHVGQVAIELGPLRSEHLDPATLDETFEHHEPPPSLRGSSKREKESNSSQFRTSISPCSA